MPTPIVCEINAPRAVQASALAEIAAALGRDVGQPIAAKTIVIGRLRETAAPVLTLHLPAELASSQHQVWCLACRLACFCPSARVSVLVTGTDFTARVPRAAKTVKKRRSA